MILSTVVYVAGFVSFPSSKGSNCANADNDKSATRSDSEWEHRCDPWRDCLMRDGKLLSERSLLNMDVLSRPTGDVYWFVHLSKIGHHGDLLNQGLLMT